MIEEGIRACLDARRTQWKFCNLCLCCPTVDECSGYQLRPFGTHHFSIAAQHKKPIMVQLLGQTYCLKLHQHFRDQNAVNPCPYLPNPLTALNPFPPLPNLLTALNPFPPLPNPLTALNPFPPLPNPLTALNPFPPLPNPLKALNPFPPLPNPLTALNPFPPLPNPLTTLNPFPPLPNPLTALNPFPPLPNPLTALNPFPPLPNPLTPLDRFPPYPTLLHRLEPLPSPTPPSYCKHQPSAIPGGTHPNQTEDSSLRSHVGNHDSTQSALHHRSTCLWDTAELGHYYPR